ncbi:hypothetical protein [Nocardia abscessus]|uniref:hypothetical protein n=1 Tax=Nocardia abscessus TaxID=120957 RepID=UPI002458E867|nr:hypothetical protein [Nocardia abscessus]
MSYHSGRRQGIPLKESAMNRSRVESLAADLSRVEPSFDTGGFVADVMAQLPELELKARIACVADALASHLPADIGAATTIILAALPPHDDATFTGSDFGLYTYAPYSDFIARYGCTRRDLESSLNALKELTKHFTAEDALRYFINAFPDLSEDSKPRARRTHTRVPVTICPPAMRCFLGSAMVAVLNIQWPPQVLGLFGWCASGFSDLERLAGPYCGTIYIVVVRGG